MILAYALTKTGHPNCRRPDKVIDAAHAGIAQLLQVKPVIIIRNKDNITIITTLNHTRNK